MAILGRTKTDVERVVRHLLPPKVRVRRSQRLWDNLNRDSTFGYMSHLRSGEWDLTEFATVGNRFVERMMARYDDYATVPANEATVLEIGCGVGRFLKPLSERFARVIGFDFSAEMLDSAREYCGDRANVEYRQNDGSSLPGVADGSVGFVVSAGVFQHITELTAILGYVREALRVLEPGGIFLFQFEGTRTGQVGFGQLGAKITARDLDSALASESFAIREVSRDPTDSVGNIVCVIERTAAPSGDRFTTHKMIERDWLNGVYDGIKTDTDMQARQAREPIPLTFYG